MAATGKFRRGFTLIELMVTLSVLVILAMLAFPSFQAVRQRAALRGAADQTLSFWSQARLEAAKRNSLVKVGVAQASTGASFCLGAATTTIGASDIATPCDCFTAGACDIAQYPATQSEWDGVTLSAVTLGGVAWPSGTIGTAVLDPKRAALITSGTAGIVTLAGPAGRKAYKLRLSVDRLGRGLLCEPTSAADKMSDFANQRCSP